MPQLPSVADAANLVAMFRSDEGVTSGTGVTIWNDLSGNGRHLVAVPGKEPVVVANALNGKPVIGVGAGVAQMKTAAALGAPVAISVYIVGRQKQGAGALSDAGGYWLSTGQNGINIYRGNNSGNLLQLAVAYRGANMQTGLLDNNFVTISYLAQSGSQVIRLNGNNALSITNGVFTDPDGPLNLFANSSGGDSGNKDFAEIRIYGVRHDAATRDAVEAELKASWAHY